MIHRLVGRIISNPKLLSKLEFRCLKMPKDRSYIPDLQKNRQKSRARKIEKADGPAYLQFLGSGAVGAPRSVYFFTDYGRYIFNVGEGTQRIAHEHGVKIARLEHIFITYPVWENIGGLPGMALTVQECGVPELTLHGPDGIINLFAATRRFVILKDLKINTAKCVAEMPYEDPVVTIHYVLLKSSEQSSDVTEKAHNSMVDVIEKFKEIQDDIDYYAHMREGKQPQIKDDSSLTVADKVCMFVAGSRSPISMSYICRLKPKLGHLSYNDCVEKNVPPGPLLGKLKAGIDITLPDGTIVKASDVKSPDEPGAVFIVVDCPADHFLDSLENHEAFRKHQRDAADKNDIPKYIIHFTPSSVMQNERYQRWMKQFHESTLHVNANDNNTCLGCVGSHEAQYKLNLIDSKVFPLLKDDSIPLFNTPVCRSESEVLDQILEKARLKSTDPTYDDRVKRKDLNLPDHMGNTLRCLPLRDVENSRLSDCIYLSPESYIWEVLRDKQCSEELQVLKSRLNSMPECVERPFPLITFLGTGSCIPNKCRNTSGILVSLAHDSHILMDCGEGTHGQLVRHFGPSRAEEILAHTNIIFVSHLHADHHLGLISLLKYRRKAVQKFDSCLPKICLMGPKPILSWLCRYQELFEEIFDCIDFVSNQDLEYRYKVSDVCSKLLSVAPLQDIVTSFVVHCPHSFGISFTDSNGTKVTYSGDTMPSENLAVIGKDSTVLIHEATFEDELVAEARTKMHSTFSEAIRMGQQMNAEFTLLTHFSQRYAKVPLIDHNFTEKVGVAFDHMEVTLNDLPKLHLFNPVLKQIFADEFDVLQVKTTKRRKISLLRSSDEVS